MSRAPIHSEHSYRAGPSAFVLALCSAVLLVPAGRARAPTAVGCVEVLQQRLRDRRLRRGRRRPVEHGQRHHRHGPSCRADERRAGRRRRAGGVSLLAGRDIGRSRMLSTFTRRRRSTVRRWATPLGWDLPPTTGGLGGTGACQLNGGSGQQGLYLPRRRPAVSRRGRPERAACHQQARRLSRLVAEQRHGQNAWRQSGHDLPASGPGDAAERNRDLRRHVREASARHPPSAVEGFYDSATRPDRSPTLPGARTAT